MVNARNEKFLALSEYRVNKILEIFYDISKMPRNINSQYKYDFKDVKEVFKTYYNEIEKLDSLFKDNSIKVEFVKEIDFNADSTDERYLNFYKVFGKRFNKIFKVINQISNLSNKKNYNYEKYQIDKMINALKSECDLVRSFEIEKRSFKFNNNKSLKANESKYMEKQLSCYIPEKANDILVESQSIISDQSGKVTKGYVVAQALFFYGKLLKECGDDISKIENISLKDIKIES